MIPKGHSIHIGLNSVDAVHYGGWEGLLSACENDVNVYKAIAEKAGFEKNQTFLTKQATSENVLTAIEEAKLSLVSGDILFITYAGHGGKCPDLNKDEDDGFDETWCLYNRELIDDELHNAFSGFKEGVRILLFSDSCHSGTIARGSKIAIDPTNKNTYRKSRSMPMNVALRTYNNNKSMYDKLLSQPVSRMEDIPAFVLQFGACQDEEEALEFSENGLFTARIRKIMEVENKDYKSFFDQISLNFSESQHPKLFSYGNLKYNFLTQNVFSIHGNTTVGAVFEKLVVDDSASEFIIERGFQDRNRDKDSTLPENFYIKLNQALSTTEWDTAYKMYLEDSSAIFVEPNIKSEFQKRNVSRSIQINEYLKNWPQPEPTPTEFIWHLDESHSQLRMAMDAVVAKLGDTARVRVGHIDTGYVPNHPSLPKNLKQHLGVSFVKNEHGHNMGIDISTDTFAETDWHGCGTLSILAGNEIKANDSYGGYEGFFGAVPFAEVVPIRICDTVFNLLNANDVARGIDYAVDQGCEVITMSMAGYPTKRVAAAVNRAYEKGVIVVTAAGNSFRRGFGLLSPKAQLYPARFVRVIAATGTCYNHKPYDMDANPASTSRMAGVDFMQGNWGPESAMKTAVAAYTPNVAWASPGRPYKFRKSGGGTSSATPQIAATAALWIAYNREAISEAGIEGTWKKVEAVRHTIFSSACKTYPAYKKYYGNGIIRANDALNAFDFNNVGNLKQSPEAKVEFTGLISFVSSWFRSRGGDSKEVEKQYSGLKEMVSLELMQLIYRDPELFVYAEELDLENDNTGEMFSNLENRKQFSQQVLNSPLSSEFLKSLMEKELE